jgi:hypothetical protein
MNDFCTSPTLYCNHITLDHSMLPICLVSEEKSDLCSCLAELSNSASLIHSLFPMSEWIPLILQCLQTGDVLDRLTIISARDLLIT